MQKEYKTEDLTIVWKPELQSACLQNIFGRIIGKPFVYIKRNSYFCN